MSLQGIQIFDVPRVRDKIGRYVIGPKLGVGTTANVHAARRENSPNWKYALKIMHVTSSWKDTTDLRELKELLKPVLEEYHIINHIHKESSNSVYVVPFYDVYVSHNKGTDIYVWLVMDRFKSDASKTGPRNYPNDTPLIKRWLIGMLQTLIELKKLNIVHRDIKPKNMLVSDKNDLYLSDFGSVCDFKMTIEKKCNERHTTFAYSDPLMFKNHQATFQSDLFALGLTFATIALGIPYHPTMEEERQIMRLTSNKSMHVINPYDTSNGEAYAKIQTSIFERLSQKRPAQLDKKVWDAIMAMIDPKTRNLTAEDILKSLTDQHPPKVSPLKIYFFSAYTDEQIYVEPAESESQTPSLKIYYFSAYTDTTNQIYVVPQVNPFERYQSFVLKSIERCKRDPLVEFEARIGSGVSISGPTFHRVLDSFSKWKLRSKEYTEVDCSLNNDLRASFKSLDQLEEYLFGKRSVPFACIRKDRFDILDDKEYGVRFSLAREIPSRIQSFSPRDVGVIREKKRISMYYKNMTRFDFTVVNWYNISRARSHNDLHYFKKTFEIELEYVKDKDDNGTTPSNISSKFIEQVFMLVQYIQDSEYLMNTKSTSKIRHALNQLTGGSGGSKITGPQPTTFHREHLNSLDSQAVSVKKDGERQLILFKDTDVVGIDRNQNMKLLAKLSGMSHQITDTLVDAELMPDKTVYVFDIIVYNGNDLRESLNLPKRLLLLEDWFDNLNELGLAKTLKFKLKKNFVGPEAYDFVSDYFKRPELRENSDGLIFTPLAAGYPKNGGIQKGLIKWKPRDQLSIDFLLETHRGEQQLNIVDQGNTLIPFPPESRLVRKVDLPDGIVVECVWDYEARRWRVHRPRYDKTKPNFITVAMDVWKAIDEPVEPSDILSSLRKSIN